MEHPYQDISESERIERDWEAEKRAEARFSRETYTDQQEATGRVAEKLRKRNGKLPEGSGKQLNLFEEVK